MLSGIIAKKTQLRDKFKTGTKFCFNTNDNHESKMLCSTKREKDVFFDKTLFSYNTIKPDELFKDTQNNINLNTLIQFPGKDPNNTIDKYKTYQKINNHRILPLENGIITSEGLFDNKIKETATEKKVQIEELNPRSFHETISLVKRNKKGKIDPASILPIVEMKQKLKNILQYSPRRSITKFSPIMLEAEGQTNLIASDKCNDFIKKIWETHKVSFYILYIFLDTKRRVHNKANRNFSSSKKPKYLMFVK